MWSVPPTCIDIKLTTFSLLGTLVLGCEMNSVVVGFYLEDHFN